MGTDRQTVVQPCSNKMAKVICLLAWAGLATAAPQGRYGVSTTAVVDNIISQLDVPINNAIEAALRGLYNPKPVSTAPVVTSFTGTVSQAPAITVLTSGTFSNYDNLEEDSAEEDNYYGGNFNGFSTSSGDSSAFNSNSFSEDSSSTFSSNSFSEDSSSFFSSNSFQSSGNVDSSSLSGITTGSSSTTDQSSVVSQVVSQLSSQIDLAVQAALAGLNTEEDSSEEDSSEEDSSEEESSDYGGNFRSSGFSTAQHSGQISTGVVSGQQVKTQSQTDLVTQIISALTPTITQQVQFALGSSSQSSS